MPEAILYSPHVGEEYPIEVAIDPKGLGNCIGVELVVTPVEDGQMKPYQVYELNVIKTTADSTVFHIDYQLSAAGTYKYSFRMYPKNPDQTGGEYIYGQKIANTYKVTYEIPNIEADHFYPNDSPKCGYGTDPVVKGGLWNVKRNYFGDYSGNKMILTTFCVQLDGKTWYPRNPQDIEWNFMIVE